MAKKLGIWDKVPKDNLGNYLEAPTDNFGISVASDKIALATIDQVSKGREINLSSVVTGPPGGAQTWFYNGPSGTSVNIKLLRIPNTGGHYHGGASSDAAAVGVLSNNSFVLNGPYPQNFKVIHRYSEVCGSIKILNTFSTGPSQENQANVLIPGFIPIVQSPILNLKAPRPEHPSPYWGTSSFVQKIIQLASEYHRQRNKSLTVTDACLEWGGRFDLNQNWVPPHSEHRDGHQADLRSNDMNNADKKAFLSIASSLGVEVLVESDHWHIRG